MSYDYLICKYSDITKKLTGLNLKEGKLYRIKDNLIQDEQNRIMNMNTHVLYNISPTSPIKFQFPVPLWDLWVFTFSDWCYSCKKKVPIKDVYYKGKRHRKCINCHNKHIRQYQDEQKQTKLLLSII